MKKELKTYARFFAPGSFVANDWTRPVEQADPYAVKWPDDAYAFTLHEREDVVDGETRYEGKPRQIGPTYYHPDSKVETLDEVRRNPKAGTVLVSNMECNGWDRIVWSRWGNWPQPYEPDKARVLERHNFVIGRQFCCITPACAA